jgi:hypothetical protein
LISDLKKINEIKKKITTLISFEEMFKRTVLIIEINKQLITFRKKTITSDFKYKFCLLGLSVFLENSEE